MDEVLGPIFNDVAEVDWNQHLPLLERFWNTQLFGAGTYQGAAMPAHIRLHRRFPRRDEHFDRWLDLFCDVVDARFVGPMAENTKHRPGASPGRSVSRRWGPRRHALKLRRAGREGGSRTTPVAARERGWRGSAGDETRAALGGHCQPVPRASPRR